MSASETIRRQKWMERTMTASGFGDLVLQLDKALFDRNMNVKKDQVLRGGRLPGSEQEKLLVVATPGLWKEVMLDVMANEYFTLSRIIDEGTSLILKILSNPKHPAYGWAQTMFLEGEMLADPEFNGRIRTLERHRLWDRGRNLETISRLIPVVAERIRKEDTKTGCRG